MEIRIDDTEYRELINAVENILSDIEPDDSPWQFADKVIDAVLDTLGIGRK